MRIFFSNNDLWLMILLFFSVFTIPILDASFHTWIVLNKTRFWPDHEC